MTQTNATRPGFFEQGFRPFFFSASAFAALAVPIWLAIYGAGIALPGVLSGIDWHAHEMVFGFFPAVLTGFLLTASPNWTGRKPIAGRLLASLFLLWLAGRLAMAFGGALGPGFDLVARGVDIAFLAAVSVLIWHEILAGHNTRNIPICALVTLVAAANLLFHLENVGWLTTDYGLRTGLALIAFLISLIGGRVIPAFTRNWMAQRRLEPLPTLFSRFDKIVLAVTMVVLIAWIAEPDLSILGFGFLIAGLFHVARMGRWSGWKTGIEPLVLILHLGYAWLVAAFLMIGFSLLAPDLLYLSSAFHALTAGAIGTMTIAIMSRASLGHSGRPLTVTPATLLAYSLITLGAGLRVFAESLPGDTVITLTIGGLIWSTGFLVFIISYGPVFIPALERPRTAP